MTVADPKAILGRIMVASKESPIAVFKVAEEDLLEAVFANCVGTRERIDLKINLVGLFNQTMNIKTTFNILLKYSRENLDYNV